MTDTSKPDDGTDDTDLEVAEDVLEAFNAEEVVERPGQPPKPEDSPTSDADAPAPG